MYKKLNSTETLIQRTTMEAPSTNICITSGGEPALARLRLTLWAMPVYGDGSMTALRTRIEMAP
jgi:hypothetical protein